MTAKKIVKTYDKKIYAQAHEILKGGIKMIWLSKHIIGAFEIQAKLQKEFQKASVLVMENQEEAIRTER